MKTIKLSDKNLGRTVKVGGKELEIGKILVNKEKFRGPHKEGGANPDFAFDDIDEATELVIEIK